MKENRDQVSLETEGTPRNEGVCFNRMHDHIWRRRYLWTAIGVLGVGSGITLFAIAVAQHRDSRSVSSNVEVVRADDGLIHGRCGRGGCPSMMNSTPTTSPFLLLSKLPSSSPSLLPSPIPTDVSSNAPSLDPTPSPSTTPSESHQPTKVPSQSPSSSQFPSTLPTSAPTHSPTEKPTTLPTKFPSFSPTTLPPTSPPTRIAFNPGDLTVRENGLLLSTGLTSRLLATTEQRVRYDTGGQSSEVFHRLPDFGATFPDPNESNAGGWIYVSNSEVRPENGVRGQGGVGALTFDAEGRLINYQRVLQDTTSNCGGGKTPWGAWISCEEFGRGQNWQVDPTGERPAQVITLGRDGGVFESFSYDVRDPQNPTFYVTEDHFEGAMQRFRPDAPDWKDPWSILLGPGTTDFLVLEPNNSGMAGRFYWTSNRARAKQSAMDHYPNSEGIDIHNGELFFISKRYASMYTLNLDQGTYTVESTRGGLFNGGPDQIKRILNDKNSHLLFFTEDGSASAGIHARNENGNYLTILESPSYQAETTGLAFSPDGKAMYVAYQVDGLLFEIRRQDGLPFDGRTLNVNYHAADTS